MAVTGQKMARDVTARLVDLIANFNDSKISDLLMCGDEKLGERFTNNRVRQSTCPVF